MKTVEFIFDFGSPNAYLAHRVIPMIEARTGATFACEHEQVRPDMYLLGKALGGGIVPVSAVVSSREVLGVFQPGQHGSTFGGNPLACAVGREVIALLATGEYQERSAKLGEHLHDRLSALPPELVRQVRGRGLWAGIEFTSLPGRVACERLAAHGVLAKDTHGTAIRLAPPLVLTWEQVSPFVDFLRTLPAAPAQAPEPAHQPTQQAAPDRTEEA